MVFPTYFFFICMQDEHFAKEAGTERPDIILFAMHEESYICGARRVGGCWVRFV